MARRRRCAGAGGGRAHLAAAERARAEEALRMSQARLRSFVEASSDAVYRMTAGWQQLLDLEGNDFLADTTAPTATRPCLSRPELETTPGWVLLRAEDNSLGLDPAVANRPGLGLRSIRDRVARPGGQPESGSLLTGGAYVRMRIPLFSPAAPAYDTPFSR